MSALNGLTILTVDDSHLINEYARSILEKLGAKKVFTASSGDDACVCLRRNKDIDLVITDIQMDYGNGLDLLKSIRTGEDNIKRDLPVIVVTDFSYKENVIKSLQLNCNGFVSKPINGKILLDKIKEATSKAIELKSVEEYAQISTSLGDSNAKKSKEESQHKETLIARVKASGGILKETPSGWTPEYKTRNEHIDKIVHQIIHLQEVLLKHFSNASNNNNTEYINELLFLTQKYISEEEKIHTKAQYSKCIDHNNDHEKILKMTQIISKAIIASHEKAKIKIYLQKLRETWHNHLLDWDQDFNNNWKLSSDQQ
ncbi:response regulator [Nitrincola nitratireducens]|uniref:Response regulatory domain-containing protein n=1 Tax=Nitrincola nitratireducens TaxID=1229521 RepID=W9VN47_9GAMM|nr:response regulator [Nitrincola nitratireducens]EXJ11920.1 hypothetical protein D791_01293 [Nitrincola nitratireducens]